MNQPAVRILLLLGLVLLAACSPAAPSAAPTQDSNLVQTQVAATVFAQIPTFLALTPSATMPPTATVQPTATISSTPTQTITATTVTPVATSSIATLSPDRAQFVAQSVEDGTKFTPGQTFTMTWTLKNTGPTTWTGAYRLRFFAGNSFGAPNFIMLNKEVKPGETIDIGIAMKAPSTTGEYRSDWVMSNAAQSNFKEPVYLKITVALPPTATRTATNVPTAAHPTATDTPKP